MAVAGLSTTLRHHHPARTAHLYLQRWLLYFVIAIGLGYAAVFRYSPPTIGGLSDSGAYFAITEHGIDANVDGHWRYRLLVPLAARPLRALLYDLTGKPESTAAALLVVNAAFVATTALVIGMLAVANGAGTANAALASLIWLCSFAVVNYQLAGMVDSVESLALALVLLAGSSGRWPLVLAVPLLAFGKETLVPISAAAAIGFILCCWQRRESCTRPLAWTASFAVLGIASVALTHRAADGSWPALLSLITDERGEGDFAPALWQAIANEGMLYVFIALLPAGIIGGHQLPPRLWAAAGCAALAAVTLGVWRVAGPNTARPLFSALGPLLAIGTALWLGRASAR